MTDGDETPSPDIDDLLDELEDLEESVDSASERAQVRETMRLARRVDTGSGVFGKVVKGFDRGDVAEALVGSVVFGIPMLVEGGTLEVGAFIATHAGYYLATLAFGVALVIGILYVAEIQDVRVHNPLFGVIPRRLVGVLGVAFSTALAMMTAWGRVDWGEPTVAFSQVTVCFVAMAIGAALGDILPEG
ncbi:DUF2391 domain-containing protein [Halostella sp. JP-L12]|uniref:DUF2391 domain-containing protein n=1 Tax=Halostella TaxID=1843185 RepID=UPI000EF7EEA6|nr:MULTISPECIES: DUF2391 domain-containing protein [Halostella]NHN48869.1 DUF2391 domain-containing protein [Halostella sp. JP-L12]